MMIEDSTGDAAVFEYINGKLQVHHGRQYIVMTNHPSFDKQIESLISTKVLGGINLFQELPIQQIALREELITRRICQNQIIYERLLQG